MAMTERQVQLVIAAQNGDISSFEELFTIFYEKVHALARMILRNTNEAEDILQETFVTAWRKLNTLKTPQTFSVWIQIIAKNLCNMQLRRKNIAILLDAEQDIENFDAEESDELLPAVYAERADLKQRLGRIIDGLSEVQRQAIVLYYFNELTVDEISDVMECSANTVKTRLYLARKTIRSEIEEQERKSGEKFYGVAGVPMLLFGKLMRSHMESLSIDQSVANAALNAITNSISSTDFAESAATAAETQNVNTTGNESTIKMSLKAKIIIGISAAAVVATVILVVAFLVSGETPKPGETFKPAESNHNSENEAAVEPGKTPEPTWSIQPTEPGIASGPTDSAQTGTPGQLDAPTPPASPITDKELHNAVANLPRSDAVDILWYRLSGYWTAADNQFVGFTFTDGLPCVEFGYFRTEWGFIGELTDATPTGDYKATLTIHIPAQEANMISDAREEMWVDVYIDVSDIPADGKIKIKIEIQASGGWYQYAWGGDNLTDAYDNIH